MNTKNIIIAGSGGHAKVMIDLIEQLPEYGIAGIVTNDKITSFEGYEVLGDDSILPNLYKKGIDNIAIGIGGFTNTSLRELLFRRYISLGFNTPSLIHPNTYVSKRAVIGKGVTILSGCTVMTNAILNDNVLVYSNSSIDHETIIHEHVLISAGVTIGAYDVIGENSLLALGSKVISGVTIGANVLVAAGAVVTKDIPHNQRVFGIPAKIKNEK